jgi:hypothetical protein
LTGTWTVTFGGGGAMKRFSLPHADKATAAAHAIRDRAVWPLVCIREE